MRILLVFLFLLFPLVVFAQSILINEIAWMGTPIAGVEEKQWWRYEWFELFNAADQPVALEGWTVELSREKLDFLIPLKGEISSRGYFLVGASDKISNLDLNYKNLGGKFFNGGQKVVLKNSLGEIIDEVNATSGWPAGENDSKRTMERIGRPGLTMQWQTSAESGGTPKSSNSEGAISATLAELRYEYLSSAKEETKDETEKDPAGSSSPVSFQGRVPVVNPITLLAGLLALGFSGVLLVLKRSLASRQERQKV